MVCDFLALLEVACCHKPLLTEAGMPLQVRELQATLQRLAASKAIAATSVDALEVKSVDGFQVLCPKHQKK